MFIKPKSCKAAVASIISPSMREAVTASAPTAKLASGPAKAIHACCSGVAPSFSISVKPPMRFRVMR